MDSRPEISNSRATKLRDDAANRRERGQQGGCEYVFEALMLLAGAEGRVGAGGWGGGGRFGHKRLGV